ncbi:hypothetical protein DKK70_08555 [Gilliamella apicola]|uniref:DUF7336 domain-containing protein n=1 Tax=Gilliamella apicola TaxID=1196095 RepID=A0A2V4E9H5_9GAMM|nr:hypothetical protein DKK70_08555 [Gilliamella apicola]
MQKIYYLYHVRYEDTDDEDFRIIGIYSSRKQAKLAIERMKKKPGFIDFPNGFQIIASVLNRAEWLEGFVTC